VKKQDHTLSLSANEIFSSIVIFVSDGIPDRAIAPRMRLYQSLDDVLVALGKHEMFKALYSWPQLSNLGDIEVGCQ
jgi:hypothetical protein